MGFSSPKQHINQILCKIGTVELKNEFFLDDLRWNDPSLLFSRFALKYEFQLSNWTKIRRDLI